jgi:hypothetical protein
VCVWGGGEGRGSGTREKNGERRAGRRNEWERGARVTYRGDPGPEPRTVYYFSALSGPYHPSTVRATSSPTAQSSPVARRASFWKLRHRRSLGDATSSSLATISPSERAKSASAMCFRTHSDHSDLIIPVHRGQVMHAAWQIVFSNGIWDPTVLVFISSYSHAARCFSQVTACFDNSSLCDFLDNFFWYTEGDMIKMHDCIQIFI